MGKEKDNIDDLLKYPLFAPNGKIALTTLYPELKDIDVLNKISSSEVMFCWAVGCATSPFHQAYKKAKGNSMVKLIIKIIDFCKLKIPEHQQINYEKEDYPSDIEEGIKAFIRFNHNARIRAKVMIEKMFDNYESFLNMDIEGNDFKTTIPAKHDKEGNELSPERKEKDLDKIAKYVTSSKIIRSQLQELINDTEEAFGVTDLNKVKDSKSPSGGSMMDQYHENH